VEGETEHVDRRRQQRGVDVLVEQLERPIGGDEEAVWSYDHCRVREVAVEDRVQRVADGPEGRVVQR
jgi:hypothetical protein